MSSSRLEKTFFALAAVAVFAFLYIPLAIIVLYAFNKTAINSWPFPGFSTRWFDKLIHDPVPRNATWLSIQIAAVTTLFSLVLGTGLAFAFARYRFWGSEAINFAVTLPIILPGIITGVALASFFLYVQSGSGFAPLTAIIGDTFSAKTVTIGHITFCIVLVFNNVLARLRRISISLEEASRDLGANGFQTFWHVTLPSIRTALIAGALLSFALSFDEIAVTYFLAGAGTNTLPLWVFGAFRNSQNLPEVNAAAAVILLISIPMIAIAGYLMREAGASTVVAEKIERN